jgi:hypothetical protein
VTTYLVEARNSGTGSPTTGSVPVPSGGSGHPARVKVEWDNSTATCTPTDSLWVLVPGTNRVNTTQAMQTAVFEKTLGPSDATMSFTFSPGARYSAAIIVAVDGEFSGDPSLGSTLTLSTSQAVPASNTADALADAICLMGIKYNSTSATGATAPAGWTELADTATSNTSGAKTGVWVGKRDAQVSSGGASGAAVVTTADARSYAETFLVKDAVVSTVVGTGWRFGFGQRGPVVVVTPPPPPPPPPVDAVLAFGTTLFGAAYSRYKTKTISSTSARYTASESDMTYTLNGVPRAGGAVSRVYLTSSSWTWSQAHPSFLRDDQPVITSFKAGTEGEATFKANVRAGLNSKPTDSAFMWLAFWHEPDDEIFKTDKSFPGTSASDITGKMNWWITRNRWVREVLDETAFAGRSDIRFGPIFTSEPYLSITNESNARSWRSFYNNMVSERGGADTWEFMGGDHYNTQWNDSGFFPTIDKWMERKTDCYAATGLPYVNGEGSTARPYSNFTTGYSKAQLETMRTDWVRELLTAVRDAGYHDAFCWWREPALGSATQDAYTAPFSTIMATQTGYDAELQAAGIPGPPHGFDAPTLVAVHSEFQVKSIDIANTNFTAGLAPHTISYQT